MAEISSAPMMQMAAEGSGTVVSVAVQGTTLSIGPAITGAAALALDCVALQRDTERQIVVWLGPDGAPAIVPPAAPSRRYAAVVTLPPRRFGVPPSQNTPAPLLPFDMAAVRITRWPLPSTPPSS